MSRKLLVILVLLSFSLLGLALAGRTLVAESTEDATLIRLQAFAFDPLADEPELGSSLTATAPEAGTATYLVQFHGPVQDRWKVMVEQTGARLYGYIPDNAFIARMDAAAARAIQSLPAVRWVGLYHPAYRLAPDLLRPTVAAATTATVSILTLPDANLDALADHVSALGGAVLGQAHNAISGILRASLPAEQVTALARLDSVTWIEPYFEPKLLNDTGGGGIMRAAQVRQDLGLYGAGQIVAVSDSGLDMGATNNLHPDFQGRLVQAYCLGRPTPCDWSDRDGHGTHVAGSVLGSGAASGSDPDAHQYAGSFAGVAPEARLVFQSLDDTEGNLGGIPDDRGDLMRQAYAAGARIHTNSWGGPTGGVPGSPEYGGYVVPSQQIDTVMWEQPGMLVLYSAGNNGTDQNADGVVDPDSLGQPGTAKNVLTVGASENNRPGVSSRTWGDGWPANFPVNPVAGDLRADAPDGMAAFSSRGPTDDGRIKPDVAAPGTYILSTRSRDPNVGNAWGAFNQYYYYQGGTSMATPLTAGAVAVVREWLTARRGVTNPSGALMKAVLVNGAADMSPGQYGTGIQQEVPSQRPNVVSGWGRVDLVESLMPAGRQVWVKDETAGLGTNGSRTYRLTVGGGQVAAAQVVATRPRAVVQGNARPVAPEANILQNGGFENSSAWISADMDYTIAAAHSGNRAMASTPGLDGYVYQLVQIPANATAATLSYWWRNEDGDEGFDVLQASIYTGDLSEIIGSGPEHSAPDADWYNQALNLGAILDDLRGQTVAVVFDVRQDGAAPDATLFVDDVVLDVQTSGGVTPTPTATATPPAGATPTPTATRPPGDTGPLRITLAWTDYPGEPAAAKALVNDLDLEVIAPDGARYRGNTGIYTGGQCLRGGQWDACNNVEGVIIANATDGVYQVIVRGANVPQGPQPFALAVSGINLYESGGQSPTATPTLPAGKSRSTYLPVILNR